MIKSINNNFPSQVVSDLEKASFEYGEKVGKAISSEWWGETHNGKFNSNQKKFHELRLYARGEQSTRKYKKELAINGDLSYLNLDWKPVPIIAKFVDIVVNGMADRVYDIKAFSQDPFGVTKRTEYMESMLRDMRNKEFDQQAKALFNADLKENTPDEGEDLPRSKEELAIHMQLTYKQSVEIAEEQAINTLLAGNRYELVKKRFFYDLTIIGIGCVKTSFNHSMGVVIDYVDPANIVYSHSESPYFEDLYYIGEVKSLPVNELVKEFPFLTNEVLEEAVSNKGTSDNSNYTSETADPNILKVLYFNFKTFANEVYKVKETKTGGKKAIKKTDKFNPPSDMDGNFTRKSKQIEVLYEGVMILGSNKLIKWELAKNMLRPKSDYSKVKMNYALVAPKMYQGNIESLVGRITGFADMIQLTHLKLQQVMSRMVPDGIYLDADGLAEIDLGNGTNYNPQEALNMFFQTGSVIGRSFTGDGDMNPGKIPIQEISSGSGGSKMQTLIGTYNYYLQMMRDVTGLNEARDGSTPDPNALVGVQKLAAANSNTATRHILQAGLFLTAEVAEALSLRVSDIIEYSPAREAFVQSIGSHNMATLEEISELHLYDFGIFIDLAPDDEQKALLENNIQVALAQKSIELEDAIDLRDIKNIKLANQLLKIRRKLKIEKDQAMQQKNIQAQSQANIQAQQAAAEMEVKKQQQLTQSKIELEKFKATTETARMTQEAAIKKQLMDHEFDLNMQLKGVEVEGLKKKESTKEDRKDERTKIQATQQSELIDQRKNEKPPKNFESAGNDILGNGFGLGVFDPK